MQCGNITYVSFQVIIFVTKIKHFENEGLLNTSIFEL